MRGQVCLELSQLHNQPRSDARSPLCLLCCTKHAKATGGMPQQNLKIVCFNIDLGGIFTYKNSQVSSNLLNFWLKRDNLKLYSLSYAAVLVNTVSRHTV